MDNNSKQWHLSVVIVNWNRCEDLRYLLNDLSLQTQPADEIIIVDNGSTDGSPEMVEKDYSSVRLIRLQKNAGLSYGRNVGISAATKDLILVLDNDLRILDRFFIEKVINSSIQHSDCGIISFLQICGIWGADGINESSLTMESLRNIAASCTNPSPPEAYYGWIFYGGACVMRKDIFEIVGLFDDFFRYGGEEWDFAYRCHANDIRLLHDSSLWVVHVRSPNMRTKSNPNLIFENMVIAQARYLPVLDLLAYIIFQFIKTLADAAREGQIVSYFRSVWGIACQWKSEVGAKRKPVSQNTVRKFYYLRSNMPKDYQEVEDSRLNVVSYYRKRGEFKQNNKGLHLFVHIPRNYYSL